MITNKNSVITTAHFAKSQKRILFLGLLLLSNQDKIRQVALNMIEFFKAESCGQCTPCRVGCEKAVTIMNEKEWDIELLEDLCEVMESSSICGLG